MLDFPDRRFYNMFYKDYLARRKRLINASYDMLKLRKSHIMPLPIVRNLMRQVAEDTALVCRKVIK